MLFKNWLVELLRKQPLSRRSTRRRRNGDVALAVELLEDRALLSTFTVTSTSDTIDANPGDGIAEDAGGATTLRAAVMEANALAGDDVINAPAGIYTLSVTGTDNDDATSGDLVVSGNLDISGAGATTTLVDADGLFRVFEVFSGNTVNLSGMTITGGRGSGAGIYNAGTLTLFEVAVHENTAADGLSGGGIANIASGSLTIDRSTISDNHANDGGGIRNWGTLTVTNSTISGNELTHNEGTSANGGGILSDGPSYWNTSWRI